MAAQLTLYGKARCHLCDVAKEAIERVRAEVAPEVEIELEVVDIETDPELVERYGLEIPVLLVDGKKAAKLRIDEAALKKRLRGAAA